VKIKYTVNITGHAQNDIHKIYTYIAEDSPNNARSFINRLENKIYSLELLPELHPIIPENILLEANYRHLIFKKYRVIFRISGYNVFILRVIHGSQLLLLPDLNL